MKFPQPLPLTRVAEIVGARQIIGDANLVATGINEIHKVEPGDIMFVDNKKYFKPALESAATIILVNEATDCPAGKALLVCENPFKAYQKLTKMHRPWEPLSAMISDSAQIHPSAIIEPNVVVGHRVRIGANTYVQAGAIIHDHTTIGKNVVIHSGAIIGTDAFYFQKLPTGYQQWHTAGQVIIEDDVYIGAGCTINKGVSGDTVIGKGSKLDCQIHIGHGAVIGEHCLLAGQVGIGGKTIIGDRCVLYGQVGVAQNLEIGAGAVILAKSGVSKNLEGGKVYFGYPAGEVKTKYKELAALRHLPDFYKSYYKE